MLNQAEPLDRVFQALADPTRRRLVERLALGPASVSELAKPHKMSLPAVHQHLGVLESAGLVKSTKHGRVRTCELETRVLDQAEQWILDRRRQAAARLDRLGAWLEAHPEAPQEQK